MNAYQSFTPNSKYFEAMENKHLEKGQIEGTNRRTRIIRFAEDTLKIIGKPDYFKYSAQIEAIVTNENGVVLYGKVVNFTYDCNDLNCYQFYLENDSEFKYLEYDVNLYESLELIKRRIVLYIDNLRKRGNTNF